VSTCFWRSIDIGLVVVDASVFLASNCVPFNSVFGRSLRNACVIYAAQTFGVLLVVDARVDCLELCSFSFIAWEVLRGVVSATWPPEREGKSLCLQSFESAT
jgi:hypothetical protein